jgi:hypothetical protein
MSVVSPTKSDDNPYNYSYLNAKQGIQNSAWSEASSPMKNKSYIHNDGTAMINPQNAKTNLLVYKFYWNRENNEFFKQWNLRDANPRAGPIPHPAIWDLVETIQNKSGIKPISGLITFIIFLLVAAGGFALGYYLIRMKQ